MAPMLMVVGDPADGDDTEENYSLSFDAAGKIRSVTLGLRTLIDSHQNQNLAS